MTQKEKSILLKDLCARLPYGVKYKTYLGDVFTLKDITFSKTTTEYYIDDNAFSVDQIKPYLRPMSSMTEDEREEFKSTQYEEVVNQYPCSAAPNEIKILSYTAKTFDWLNKKHFDYRGLISKGLALKAPEGMYSI